MSLSHLQQSLQGIYELELDHQVNDFLVTRNAELDPSCIQDDMVRETLLVSQENDDLLLSLFLHESVVKNLNSDGGVFHLHDENLEDFCIALEGISHFIYVVWNAGFRRRITRLEMEIQAEVDKFIVLSKLLHGHKSQIRPGHLRRVLFDTVRYSPQLDAAERVRYRDANNFAAKYCWYLESNRYLEQEQGLLREIRRFYRLDLRGKLRRIGCLH